MKTFHNDIAVKQKYVDRVQHHIEADNIIRGTGWDNGKGCAVGCTLENYNHSRYPIELGIPEWLARVEDTLFEGMGEEKSRTWPKLFLEAIPVGIDDGTLERKVKAPFLIMVLESVLDTFDHAEFPDVKAAIDCSIALWRRDDIGSDEFKVAAEVAEAASEAASEAAAEASRAASEAAAWAAARAASEAARAATWAAAEASRAASEAATWAAEAAARAVWVARVAKYDHFAAELLKLLKGLEA